VAQQMVMTSTNNLALMLSESLDNLQNNKIKKINLAAVPAKNQVAKAKNQLHERNAKRTRRATGKMQEGMKQGKDPKKMGKDFADAVQKQAAVREALRKMKEQMSQNQKKGDDGIGGI
jgi:hypothetical protein